MQLHELKNKFFPHALHPHSAFMKNLQKQPSKMRKSFTRRNGKDMI